MLSAEEQLELELVTKGTAAFLELEREALKAAREINDREDKFVLWIVGLSAAAIAGLSTASRLAGISRWEAIIVFGLFVLSIISSLVYRWVLMKVERADLVHNHAKQTTYIVILTVLVPRAQSGEDLDKINARLKLLEEKQDPILRPLEAVTKYWVRRSKWLDFIPTVAFLLGVLALAVVASIHWKQT
jgi:hypothetical protein